jgi:hypothetical protein
VQKEGPSRKGILKPHYGIVVGGDTPFASIQGPFREANVFLGCVYGLLHNDVLKSEFKYHVLFMVSIELMVVMQYLSIVQHNKDRRNTTNK